MEQGKVTQLKSLDDILHEACTDAWHSGVSLDTLVSCVYYSKSPDLWRTVCEEQIPTIEEGDADAHRHHGVISRSYYITSKYRVLLEVAEVQMRAHSGERLRLWEYRFVGEGHLKRERQKRQEYYEKMQNK